MSRPRSSKTRVFGVAVTLAFGASLAACSHAPQTADPGANASPSSAPGNGRVGFVRMQALIAVHPLYPQLSHLDDDVAALQLRSVGPSIASSGSGVLKAQHELQRELESAADQTKAALVRMQREYGAREQRAIDAALGAAASANGPSGATIAGNVAAQARVQQADAGAAAQKNFDSYRGALVDQNRAEVIALQRSLGARAEREYRARADELQRKESDYALSLASADAADRLSLRTRLSNLALDDQARADVRKQLDALDRKESDAVGAMKNRDTATLIAFQKTLRARVTKELTEDVASLQKRTSAKIVSRADQTRRALSNRLGDALPAGGGPGAAANVTPAMRTRLLALHKQYQAGFDRDAKQTIERFQKTRTDLSQRFAQIAGLDTQAQRDANAQIATLRKQRQDLYDSMVAQIDREVKTVAQQRGIDVVVSDVLAPASGVDLTDDAKKDIESLHE